MRFTPPCRLPAVLVALSLPLVLVACQSSGTSRYALGTDTTASVRPLASGIATPVKHSAAPLSSEERARAIADASAYNLEGSAQGEAGNYKQALANFNRAIATSPGYYQAYSNRALAYIRLGRLDAAMADFDQAIHLNPSYPEARIG
ncbi:MAG: tetratricopeptide repeat protein, partial [Hyphomicrobiaceae bacterium]